MQHRHKHAFICIIMNGLIVNATIADVFMFVNEPKVALGDQKKKLIILFVKYLLVIDVTLPPPTTTTTTTTPQPCYSGWTILATK